MTNQKKTYELELLKKVVSEPPIYIVPIGIPACGKTYLRPSYCFVLCKDDLRFSIYNKQSTYESKFENVIGNLELEIFKILLRENVNIYKDSTNLNRNHRFLFSEMAYRKGYMIKYWIFRNYKQAIKRNSERKRIVPDMKYFVKKMKSDYPERIEIKKFHIEVSFID